MGLNELLLFVTVLLCAGFVFTTWELDRERLYGAIIIFLILMTSMGGEIVVFFGHETNTGNIFYASVFLATYFLIERYGRREGMHAIWVGVGGVLFFLAVVQTTVLLTGAGSTSTLDAAVFTVFDHAPRVALASLVAYVLSQNFNVRLYVYLKHRFNGRWLWLRANLVNALAQILDSTVFFVIAFWGVVAPANIGEIIVTGYVIKVVYMMLASLLLYANSVEQEEEEDYATI